MSARTTNSLESPTAARCTRRSGMRQWSSVERCRRHVGAVVAEQISHHVADLVDEIVDRDRSRQRAYSGRQARAEPAPWPGAPDGLPHSAQSAHRCSFEEKLTPREVTRLGVGSQAVRVMVLPHRPHPP